MATSEPVSGEPVPERREADPETGRRAVVSLANRIPRETVLHFHLAIPSCIVISYFLDLLSLDPGVRYDPDISPVIIEGPPIIPPWEELSYLHFNDYIAYVIKAADTD